MFYFHIRNGKGNAKVALGLCYMAIKLVKSTYPDIIQITRLHIAEVTHLVCNVINIIFFRAQSKVFQTSRQLYDLYYGTRANK